MDRIWQWAWDRHAARYIWAICAIAYVVSLTCYLPVAFLIVAYEKSDRYLEAAAVTLAALPVLVCVMAIFGRPSMLLLQRWAAGHQVDRMTALASTYFFARRAVPRVVWATGLWLAALSVVVAELAGGSGWRLVQYGILGAALGTGVQLIAYHSVVESMLRPARLALTGDTEIGDSLPRSRPTFATRSNVSVVAAVFTFAVLAAWSGAVVDRAGNSPILSVAIGCALTLVLAVPISVGLGFSPSLQPIRDLARGAERVGAGDYSLRLPVVQDDDLGALAASFNRMQAGLAERQRLQAAFGTYVDPGLAARLLEQGDDVFTGERREVSVMFVDIRDFTPFAEANTAEDTVARLNAVFEIVVPAVVDAGGHVNKFLGDGALAVFGAPNDLADHADAAVGAAVVIDRLVDERFGGALSIGIGINTGVVIAGTIGGGSKLEFTLIGDAVNVAARVEQLTKTTGDTILLTQHTVDALASRPAQLTDRGSHELKGKSAAMRLFSFDGLRPKSPPSPLRGEKSG
jgi:class 3 adenylate cyclase